MTRNVYIFLAIVAASTAMAGRVQITDANTSEIVAVSGGNLSVDSSGSTLTVTNIAGHLCTDNTTTNLLGISGVFTGAWQDCLSYGVVSIGIIADADSATDGLNVQWSEDGTSIADSDVFSIYADVGKTFTFGPARRYVRLVYTNGVVAQTSFNLQTILRATYVKPSSHRINDSIVGEDDAELVKAVLSGIDQNGVFLNVNTTEDGTLLISDNSSGLAIAKGDVTGHAAEHKFGYAPDFDTGDGEVTIWDGAEDGSAWENMRYDYSATADIDSISSSDNSDTVEIEVTGLDASTNLVAQNVTLVGTQRVALATNLYRVFRAKNENGTTIAGTVVVYPNTALTAGIPTDKSKIRLVVHPENNQTEMAVYTIPASKTGYMRSWYVGTAGANKTSNYICKIYARKSGGVFQLKHRSAVSDAGSSYVQHQYDDPLVFTAGTDIEMTVQATAVGVTAASFAGGFDLVLVDD